MHRLAKLSAEAKVLDKEIDDWFENNGYNTQTSMTKYDLPSLRDDNGISLSELTDGNDITEEFVSLFQSGAMEHYRKEK